MSVRETERGSVVVIVAVSLFALMAIATLAIDGGMLFNARRDDQNGADHAAMAAAWAFCNGADPTTAGLASAARNGFTNDGTSNIVTITDLGTDADGKRRFKAEIRSERGSAFGGTVNVSRLRARAAAVAGCAPASVGGGEFAIFASGSCPKTVDWSGSYTTVTGAVHSNNEINVGGSTNSVDGETTYEEDFNDGGGGNSFDPGAQDDPDPDDPDPLAGLFQIADFAPGGSRATAAGTQYYDYTGTKIDSGVLSTTGRLNLGTGELDDGLYFTDRDIDLGQSNLHGRVTFVTSGGQMKISGSDQNLENFDPDGLLGFSNADRPCGEYGVSVSGSNSTWTGILYAPRALVEMSGSGSFGSVINGSLVGDEVRLNGSMLDINFTDFGGSSGGSSVELLE